MVMLRHNRPAVTSSPGKQLGAVGRKIASMFDIEGENRNPIAMAAANTRNPNAPAMGDRASIFARPPAAVAMPVPIIDPVGKVRAATNEGMFAGAPAAPDATPAPRPEQKSVAPVAKTERAAPPETRAADADATAKAAEKYIKSLESSFADIPDETPEERKKRIQEALFIGGLSMMAAGSEDGANFGGSLSRGALTGFGVFKDAEERRKAEAKERQGRDAKVAEAEYSIARDNRSYGLDKQRVDSDADYRTTTAAETARANRAREALDRERIEKDIAGPKSAQRDQGAYFEELYKRTNPGASDQEIAGFVRDALTNRRGMGEEELRLRVITSFDKDPNFQFADEVTQEEMIEKRMTQLLKGRNGGGGGDPVAEANNIRKLYREGKISKEDATRRLQALGG